MTARNFSNTAVEAELSTSVAPGTTGFQVSAVTGFPSVPFTAVIAEGQADEEVILVTNVSGTTLTVTRGYNGTTAVSHSQGASLTHAAVAMDFQEANDHVNETTTAHGLTLADVITTTNTQTLTNKTLTAPVLTAPTITDFTSAAHDHGDAAGGGTIPAASVLARPINDQSGTTYTFMLADCRQHVTGSNAGTKTFTIPLQAAVTFLADAAIPVTNLGAGVMTVAITGGGTLNGSDLTLAQGESAVLLRTASDVWWCLPFSSGGTARATVSGTTGSPTVTTPGGKTCYAFTSSGTITTDTPGLVKALIIGGGGYGASGGSGGGGGAGGVFGNTGNAVDIYLPVGTHIVTVGAAATASAVSGYVALPGGHGAAGSGASGGGGGSAIYGKQGYPGGASLGGGGGAGGAGVASGGAGGVGVEDDIDGTPTYRAGGGGGYNNSPGGLGGGGASGNFPNGVDGTANTGGGGGASGNQGGAGGSGIVILLVG